MRTRRDLLGVIAYGELSAVCERLERREVRVDDCIDQRVCEVIRTA